jgi:hypothetical protein
VIEISVNSNEYAGQNYGKPEPEKEFEEQP